MAGSVASRPPLHQQAPRFEGYPGRKSHLFRPPTSPAPSSPDSSRQQINSRKRSRASSPANSTRRSSAVRSRAQPTGYFDTPTSASQAGTWSAITPNASFETPAARSAASPPPFVETRYDLAYGLDGALESHNAMESGYGRGGEDYDTRRWSGDHDAHESNGKRQRPADPNGGPSYSAGLTNMVFSFVSGVAGRMLEFCKYSSPFKGFYAGGGQGYHISRNFEDTPSEKLRRSQWEDMDASMQPASPFEMIATPIPGQYPDSPPVDRAAKRKRGEGGGWVMVPTPEERSQIVTSNTSRPRLSVRPEVGRTPSSSSVPRPISRNGSRRLAAPTVVARRNSSTATHAGSPASHGRTASTASPRGTFSQPSRASLSLANERRYSNSSRPSTATGNYKEEPMVEISPDAARYQARMKKQEREQEKSMRQMNAKLQELIREGKAALGTKVDVEMDDMEFD